MIDGSQDSDLVDGVFPLLVTQVTQLDHLQSVELAVLKPLDFENI